MPESPPVSPKTIRNGKRSRQSSRGTLSVQELSPDDMGYDADVEVLRPNEYEEADSDPDDSLPIGFKRILWPDDDEELATKMRRLSWRQAKPIPRASSENDRPRNSKPKDMRSRSLNQHGKRTELEISEMADAQDSLPPAKRRRKRNERRSPMKHGSLRSSKNTFHSSSDVADDDKTPMQVETTGSTGHSETGIGQADEAMDVD